jgi:hypothetical protein
MQQIPPKCRHAILGLLALVIAACTQPQSTGTEGAEPRSYGEWTKLIGDIRAFEHRIGYKETKNFLRFSEKKQAFPFCGYVSRLYLPYSYEDPAIHWLDSMTEQACRAFGESADVFFGESEALGESATPVTPSTLSAPLERLLYLVFHEDCHDQFAFPYGVEEALCNVIAYDAMLAFSEEHYGLRSSEYQAVERYVSEGSTQARLTISFYQQLAERYGRHERKDISTATLMRERAAILSEAGRALAWEDGAMNNVLLANAMTYSRHYPFFERVHEALGRDLVRTVAFFRRVDEIKPSTLDVMSKRGYTTQSGVDFIRAYEEAVVKTTENMLAATPLGRHAERP